MADEMIFDYFYGQEAEMLSFYRIPRMVVKDAHFACLSSDAKILYGLVLDRMSLSIKNGWQDDEDRTYIYYTIEDVMEDLNCGNKKAGNLRKELEEIGLIERVKRGQGKPDIIYVKNFMGIRRVKDDTDSTLKDTAKPQKHADVSKRHFKKCQNDISRNVEETLQEVSDEQLKECQVDTSRNVVSTSLEMSYAHDNYINTNQNELNNMEYSHINPVNPLDVRDFRSNARATERWKDLSAHVQIDPDYPILDQEMRVIDESVEYYEGLPPDILDNPELVAKYIMVLSNWDRMDYLKKEQKDVMVMVIEALTEMTIETQPQIYADREVKPGEVYNQIHRVCRYDARHNLMFFVDVVMKRFLKALSDRDVRNPRKYIKTIIWNAFNTYRVDVSNEALKYPRYDEE